MNSSNSTSACTTGRAGTSRRRGRRGGRALVLAAATVAALGPARRAAAFLDFIIFDPSALIEHVQQVAQLAEQVRQATQQAEGGIQELKHLGSGVSPESMTVVTTLTNEMEADVYTVTRPAEQLGQRYPTDLSGITPDQYAAEQATWVADERSALAENRRVQDAVEQGMAATRDQVQRIVSASNGASGETAAAQAHDDLLAVASAELAKLQALRLARSRLRTEGLALDQSEQAYGAAQRLAVRDGWDAPAPPSGTMVDAFNN